MIYSKEIEATKITSEWYLWMHRTTDVVPNFKKLNIVGKKNTLKIKPVLKIVTNQLK